MASECFTLSLFVFYASIQPANQPTNQMTNLPNYLYIDQTIKYLARSSTACLAADFSTAECDLFAKVDLAFGLVRFTTKTAKFIY